MSKKLRNIGVVSGLTIVSRVLGLMRDQLSAAVFGTSALASAFVTAFRLPNLFRRLLGEGSLTAALVPTMQETLQRQDLTAAFRLMSQVVSWLLLVSGVIVGAAMLAASQLHRWPGLEERWYMSADLAVLLFPYLIFVCVAAVFSGMLNVLQRFTEPALSPIWLNLSMITALGVAGLHFAETAEGRMYWLVAGVLLGGFLQMVVPAVVLMRLGWRPQFDLTRSPGVREIARLMAPGLWGTAIYQINLFVVQMLAMAIDDSAAAALFYANRLMELPIGVFTIAIATVIYPLIAQHAAAGRMDEMRHDYRSGVRMILVINVPAAVGLAILSVPIIRLLFERGNFDADDTQLMAPLLIAFALGLPLFSVVSLMTRAFYAVKDTTTPVKVATASFGVNLVAALMLMRPLGATGLALASTVAVLAQALMLQRELTRRLPQLNFGSMGRDVGKIVLAAAIMGAVAWVGAQALADRGRWADWVVLIGLIPGAAAVYAGVLWSLRLEGREELRQLIWRRLRPRPPRAGSDA